MLVVMAVVAGVPVAVVDVVDVVAVRYRDVTAAFAVDVVVRAAFGVAAGLTFVVMALVFAVQVTVVDVVDVVAVRHGNVATGGAVLVLVFGVLSVCCRHQNPSSRRGQVEPKSTSHITKCA